VNTNNPAGLPFDPIAEARRQWRAHDFPESERMATITSIMRVQQILLTQIERALRPFDLTFAGYEALVLLYFSRRGAVPLGKIGQRLQVHPTSVTHTIDRLEERELVRRRPHADDRRTTLAEITAKGKRLVPKATKVVIDEAFSAMPFTQSDVEEVFGILERFRARAGDFVLPEKATAT
jgi:DNA-binding MarR family transcriptional regulator